MFVSVLCAPLFCGTLAFGGVVINQILQWVERRERLQAILQLESSGYSKYINRSILYIFLYFIFKTNIIFYKNCFN